MINQSQLKTGLYSFCALLFLSFVFPLHIHPYRTYCNDALVVLGLILMPLCWLSVPNLTLRVPNIVIVPLGLIAVIALQTCLNMISYPADMTFPVIYLLLFATAMVYGSTLVMYESGIALLSRALAWTFVVAGIVSVTIEHIQLLDLDLMPWIVPLNWSAPIRPFANFAQPNTLALTLCFALASVWYLHACEKIKPVYAIPVVVFVLWGLALTQSRIGWVIVPAFALFCWRRDAKEISSVRLALFLFAALYFVLVLCVPGFLQSMGGTAEAIGSRAGQTGVRIVLWQQALAMSLEHPWFGVGWFQYGPHQILSAASYKPSEYSDYAHNLILNLLAEIGWPVSILLIMGFLYWINQCCIQKWARIEVRFIGILFIALGVHSMVEFPLWYAMFLIPFGLLLGALHTESMGWEFVQVKRTVSAAILFVSLVGLIGISHDYLRMSRGFDAIARIQAGDKRYLPIIQKPEFTLFPQYYDYFHIVEVPVTFDMAKKDVAFLEHISIRFGFPPVLSRLAIVYANQHRTQEALHVLTIVQRIGGDGYEEVYSEWRSYAWSNPGTYGEVFNRMPVPLKHEINGAEASH